ncbi:hypothetical protein D3C85_1803340 [compost metagenome]
MQYSSMLELEHTCLHGLLLMELVVAEMKCELKIRHNLLLLMQDLIKIKYVLLKQE